MNLLFLIKSAILAIYVNVLQLPFLITRLLKLCFLELSEKELQNNIFLFQTTTGIKEAVIRIGKEN